MGLGFKIKLVPVGGLKQDKDTALLLSVFIASSMSGWSGCFYLTVYGRPVSA